MRNIERARHVSSRAFLLALGIIVSGCEPAGSAKNAVSYGQVDQKIQHVLSPEQAALYAKYEKRLKTYSHPKRIPTDYIFITCTDLLTAVIDRETQQPIMEEQTAVIWVLSQMGVALTQEEERFFQHNKEAIYMQVRRTGKGQSVALKITGTY